MKTQIQDLYRQKNEGRKFPVVSCYDYITSILASQSGINVLLVGDSAAQHLLGYKTTLNATMDFMVEITAAVRRGSPDSFLIADMPFLSYQCGLADAIKNAGRFVVEGMADIVKIEATDSYLDVIKAVSDTGIAVMAHIGIRPQANILTAQGTSVEAAAELIELAERMVQAGSSALLLEGVASEVAKVITESLAVPVIGCGSGRFCDGNVLIAPDILGLTSGKKPKFSKTFGDAGAAIVDAFAKFGKAVSDGQFPDDEHSYHIKKDDLDEFAKYVNDKNKS